MTFSHCWGLWLCARAADLGMGALGNGRVLARHWQLVPMV